MGLVTKRILVIIMLTTILLGSIGANVHAARSITEGAWLGKWASSQDGDIENYAKLVGRNPGMIQTFVNTNQGFDLWAPIMGYVDSQDAINLITIEPKRADGSDFNTVDINNGALDSYFGMVAKKLGAWQNGKQVLVRFMHEANGNWYGWGIGDSKVNSNKSYINAYRRVVSIFRKYNANNVKFVFNINCDNVGKNTSYMGMYPGDAYVDYVSIDGYNWGTSKSYSTWKSFDNIFKASYQALCSGTKKPLIITEYASTELGGDKAGWIKDAANQIKSDAYSRIIGALWFNENKETDWRIQSSSNSLQAYQAQGF